MLTGVSCSIAFYLENRSFLDTRLLGVAAQNVLTVSTSGRFCRYLVFKYANTLSIPVMISAVVASKTVATIISGPTDFWVVGGTSVSSFVHLK